MVKNEIWFITGSQHLYGEETLLQVENHTKEIAAFLNTKLVCPLIVKTVAATSEQITDIMKEANYNDACIGVITWMHTFSPSRMWISGLNILQKPILHLHTQYNEKIPYNEIDMDFMNLNQSAHGDREHGFIYAAMRKNRKVVAGYWKDENTIEKINIWIKAALGYHTSKHLKVCRFGDNMRDVAVTEGNKVSAEIQFGWNVNTYGIGDLVEEIQRVSDAEAEQLVRTYKEKYTIVTENMTAIKEQAKYEIAIEKFMKERGCEAYTTTFEDLHGMKQLPGLACQRLMEKGYGFGAEGDWKTAAMTRILKAMSDNTATAFMEDYTYHLEKGQEAILGAHMLEVCPTIAESEIRIDVQPLGIGGKEPPARMLFEGRCGDAICVSLIDLGNRFRIIAAEVEGIKIPQSMPKLPVASAMWKPYPNFQDGVTAWILAGGAHHSVLSYTLTTQHIMDFARMANIECIVIGKDTNIRTFEQELMFSDMIWNNK